MRSEYLILMDGQPVQVCQGLWESLNRWKQTCQTYITDESQNLVAGTAEIVFYDGTLFVRENDSQTWFAAEALELGYADPSITNLFRDRISSLNDEDGPVVVGTADTGNGQQATPY
ncbi:MAG: hypothetical protein HC893_07035 [Chloroflexaceae bacterium]|nr:hypothetical protein [Chloroflexaceae bacterium]